MIPCVASCSISDSMYQKTQDTKEKNVIICIYLIKIWFLFVEKSPQERFHFCGHADKWLSPSTCIRYVYWASLSQKRSFSVTPRALQMAMHRLIDGL